MNAATFAARRARLQYRYGTGKRFRLELQHLVRDAGAAMVIVGGKVVAYRMTTGEVVCIKKRFRDSSDAQVDMLGIQVANPSTRVPVRVYLCPYCKGWHLTSETRARAANQHNYEEVA
ncbi:hypothetical protein LMG31506_03026 [Cupriavidus yeoncheonensis]|uniref:Uncharacterized protein n=1 Tax=Cupriavidus yeoncheonensis TaxID=1462994 RepID=A0A916IXM3_9BURK|nr:hypothetical protein [Cupriavidus yeoncheonensis]CAG2144532.1 hypothetical protein LMG31506_03026 [Cupriavidus yeoncheonensis]